MFRRNISYLLLLCLLGQACSSTKPARPQEFYNDIEMEDQISVMNLPIRIFRPDLERSINQQMGSVLFEDNDLRDDGLMVRAKKQSNITLELLSNSIKYKVPIDLWLRKDLAFTSVDAEGALTLEFTTRFEVKPNWQLVTVTELSNYDWTRTPVVKTGIGNLNVTSVADYFIKQSKTDLAATIDDQVKSMFDLRSEITKAWKDIQEPMLVSEDYATWLTMQPLSIGMTPLTPDGDLIQSTVVIRARTTMSMGSRPATKSYEPLPSFGYISSATNDNFSLTLSSEIPFSEAERISKANMVGETFDFGKKKVRVEDIEMYGQGSRLVVKTKLSGSYNGDVYFTGKPEYNARKNQIELAHVEFDASSKKALVRTAAWLFKGQMTRKIQDEMNFYLNQNLDETKTAIQHELSNFALAPGLKLKGQLTDLNVSNVYIGVGAIHVKVGIQGKLFLDVTGLSQN